MAVDQTVAIATNRFLRDGGQFAIPMQRMREKGLFPEEDSYTFKEYPKMLRLNPRQVDIERTVDLANGKDKTFTETVWQYDDILVNSEDEEERVLAGGKTSGQVEEERVGLLTRCSHMNIAADPSWSSVRLKRLLGEALDAPPADEMSAMRAKLAQLEELAAMKAKIAALEAQLAAPGDDIEELRAELHSLGVEVDMRWSVKTLRAKLDQATAPGVAA